MSSPEQEVITIGETDAGEAYDLPVEDVLTGRGFVTGKSGAGKSNTGSVVVEELLERGHPVLVVDVDGEYWGLKEDFEILHVGATEECDLRVGAEHAGKLAELALDSHVPIILDASGYVDRDDADALVRETARELFTREQQAMQPFLMLVEEIHEFVPEGGGLDETGEMLIRVAKRGRKRGLGIVGLSQRPADVKKDFITQADLLVWHRLSWENDTDVVRRVVGSDYADAVQDLADGEAFVQADWSEADVERVQVRRKHTFDAGATPGLDDVERPELKSIGDDLVDELEEISDEHQRRQDRIAELEAELDAREERIEELEDELEDARDLQRLGEAFVDAAQSSGDSVEATEREILEEKNEEIAALREKRDELEDRLAGMQAEYDELVDEVERLRSIEERVEQAERIEEQLEQARDVLGVEVGERAGAADAEVQELRERVDELEAENERLRERSGGAAGDDLAGLLNHEAVQTAIETAMERASNVGDDKFDPVLSVLSTAEGEALSASEIASPLPFSDTQARRVCKALHSAGVVQKEGSNPMTFALDRDFIEQRIEVAERQAEIAKA